MVDTRIFLAPWSLGHGQAKKHKDWTLKEAIGHPCTSTTPQTTIHDLLIKLFFPLSGDMDSIRRFLILSKGL